MIGWLKQLENTEHRRAAQRGHRSYDTAWLWRELGIEAPRWRAGRGTLWRGTLPARR